MRLKLKPSLNKKDIGSIRFRRKFVIFPIRLPDGTAIFLEFITVIEEVQEVIEYDFELPFNAIKWVEIGILDGNNKIYYSKR